MQLDNRPQMRNSATPDRFTENVGIAAIVVPELKLRNVKRKVFLRHLVIAAHHAALNQRPEVLPAEAIAANVDSFIGFPHPKRSETLDYDFDF